MTQTIKKIKTNWMIKIIETNYSNNDNKGQLLGKTLKPICNIYYNGKRSHIVMKDVDSNMKFMVEMYHNSKNTFTNKEFSECIKTKYISDDWSFVKTNVSKKSNVKCLKFITIKLN